MMPQGTFLSRTAAFLLFLAACVIAFLAFAEPLIRQNRIYDETLDTLRTQRARFAAEAASLPQLRANLAAAKQRPGPQNVYVSGESASRAAAALLEAVKTAVQNGGATLASAQVLTTAPNETDKETSGRISVRTQIKATPAALQRIFHGIESGRPALFIGDVTITGRHTRKTIRNRNKQQDTWDELILDVRFAVTGFRRTDAKEKDGTTR